MTHASHEPGYPIRTSPDHRLLATSPKLIAGCDVLHRLLMSRHPPYALIVTTKNSRNYVYPRPDRGFVPDLIGDSF
jgi:hypothetical protein